jgi:hypothetical protein
MMPPGVLPVLKRRGRLGPGATSAQAEEYECQSTKGAQKTAGHHWHFVLSIDTWTDRVCCVDGVASKCSAGHFVASG